MHRKSNFFISLIPYLTVFLCFSSLSFAEPGISLTASYLDIGEENTFTINGTETQFTNGAFEVWLLDEEGEDYFSLTYYANVIDDNSIEIDALLPYYLSPQLAGFRLTAEWTENDLFVDGGIELREDPFPPTIKGLDPATVVQGSTYDIECILNSCHVDAAGSALVWLEQGETRIDPISINITNNDTIIATFKFLNSHPTGEYNAHFYNLYTGNIKAENLLYLEANPTPPVISEFLPDFATQGELLSTTIKGEYTNFASAINNRVWLRQATDSAPALLVGQNIQTPSDTALTVDLPVSYSIPPGKYNLIFSNEIDGELFKEDIFTVNKGSNPPSPVSISPDTITRGRSVDVTIKAQNTRFTQVPQVSVSVMNGPFSMQAYYINVIDDTTLTAKFESSKYSKPGDQDVIVSNQLDGDILFSGFFNLIENPEFGIITDFSPDSGEAGDEVDLVIQGVGTKFTEWTSALNLVSQDRSQTVYSYNTTPIDDETLSAKVILPKDLKSGPYTTEISYSNGWVFTEDGKSFQVKSKSKFPSITNVSPTLIRIRGLTKFVVSCKNVVFNSKAPLTTKIWFAKNFPQAISIKTLSEIAVEADSVAVVDSVTLNVWKTFKEDADTGTYLLRLVSEEYGTLEYDSSYITVNPENPTITHFENQIGFNIYPNPVTRGEIYLEFNESYNIGNTQINFYNVLGELVLHKSLDTDNNKVNIDINELNTGIYWVRIIPENSEKGTERTITIMIKR